MRDARSLYCIAFVRVMTLRWFCCGHYVEKIKFQQRRNYSEGTSKLLMLGGLWIYQMGTH